MNLLTLQSNEFNSRHNGSAAQKKEMLSTIGEQQLSTLIDKTVPATIRMDRALNVPEPLSEYQYLQHIQEIGNQNQVWKNFIGQGYYPTITPSVILRNIFENPGWYTQYTPYQAEIAQGRLESLLNFQTMVSDLTGLPIANASLLDEATAAAEAMTMLFNTLNRQDHIERPKFFVDAELFPQTIDLLRTRAVPVQIEMVIGHYQQVSIDNSYFGAIIQYPNNKGSIEDYRAFIEKVHRQGGYVIMATDLLALTLLTPPGELGADVAVGSSQRFGIPLGYGGPHAAFFAAKDEFKRSIPGRIIGISIDAKGNRALRMALQTREQHIKREKATSNICTAQALLANMAAMYAVYHGPDGLKRIAQRIAGFTRTLALALQAKGFKLAADSYFDTIVVSVEASDPIQKKAEELHFNFRYLDARHIGITLDETTDATTVKQIADCFGTSMRALTQLEEKDACGSIQPHLLRNSAYLTHPVFNTHRSESQMMRYIKQLENRDLSLNTSMISLGSCTMKLNAATEMMPLSWPGWSHIHPFAPASQTKGYHYMIDELSKYLCDITAFDACSMQPNSGAQGEYAGLLTIRAYHEANGEPHRNVMLIPISAHGTNPASAVMAGMKVVVVKALDNGYIDMDDLQAKANQYSKELSGIMITYPSTYGVYEETVKDITSIIHQHGGQVYMDGANMNAQVGLTAPGLIGADVCHLNLHKTFAIPHGGGGPGMGPICVKAHLAPFLPGHTNLGTSSAVSAAPYGSASILLISYGYIRMLGPAGLKSATEYAILNANYMRARLESHYDILYTNRSGQCAHEFIVDLRPFKKTAEIEAEDVAKRLMDYGFHAPTMSFPVAGTIMIEPTESEDKAELDRFCDALISIRNEIRAIEEGKSDKKDNPLKNAPHTQQTVMADQWPHSYGRQEAAYPLYYVTHNKFWPSVSRVNNTHGDRNLVCTCEPVSSYLQEN
ncbi:MAG: aminomethyl-transferring glycine dehydrogenase [Sphingomonadales bacterium]|nr:aminomethyl-transferring glycine dehydrogenase [Sphingomonadales bacterium]